MSQRKDVTKVIDVVHGSGAKRKKRGRGCLTVLIIILCLLLAVFGALYIYLKKAGFNPSELKDKLGEAVADPNAIFEELNDEEYNEYRGMITAMQGNSDLSGVLYNWYNSGGGIMSSKNIYNILIIGVDSTGNERMQGNSDVMMIASVNRKAKTITLCSLLRDSYTYFESPNGNGYYSKLNAAYAYGGPEGLVKAIEKNYKIRINCYAAVDFEAFEDVIDAIGGIEMDVEEFEAQGIIDYEWSYVTEYPYGKNVHLNGHQALLFARIRKIYNSGDIRRTLNQRRVINAIINKAKAELSISTLNNVIHTLAPYVLTDLSTGKIITLGSAAILGGWYDFDVYSMEAPPENYRDPYNGSQWVWIVDYPKSAQYVQTQLYGETNIDVPEGTVSAIDIVRENGMY